MNTVAEKERAIEIYRRLKERYGDVKIALNFSNPFELLVATILSAQCTDTRVNMVTGELFKRCRTPKDFAEIEISELENIVRSTGFFKNKARNIKQMAKDIIKRFRGNVPKEMHELTSLPGVGRKTANVIMGNAFGKPAITVDTHVKRIAFRLGFTNSKNPDRIEQDLMLLWPDKIRTEFSNLLIWHGRLCCKARKPNCDNCPVNDLCPKNGVE